MGGIDGYDWSPFGGNPAPGDADVVRGIAARLSDLAGTVEMQNRLLQSVSADSESIWEGPAARAFRPHVDKLPGQLTKLSTSYGDAAEALDGYWPRLQAAQQLAVEALGRYRVAQAALDDARSSAARADGLASAAADAYNHAVVQASAGPPDPTGATTVQLSGLQRSYQAASAQAAAAHAAVASADAAVSAARSLAGQARAEARAAASTVAARLHAAGAAGIHNPHHSWFASIVDDVEGVVGGAVHFVEHHWEDFVPVFGPVFMVGEWAVKEDPGLFKAASAILGTVTLVAGVLSMVPIVGEIAMPVAVVSAGLQTADDVLLAAAGEGKWGAVGWDLFGDASLGAGDGLLRVGEDLGALARVGRESGEVTAEIARSGQEIGSLRYESEALHSFDDSPVALLSRDGSTQWTKASELASETDGRLAGAEREFQGLVARGKAIAREGQKIEDLTTLGEKIRFASPTEAQGALSRTGQMFEHPVNYVRQVLSVGRDSIWSEARTNFFDQWSSKGFRYTAPSYALGGYASYKGGTMDASAYHDWHHPERHGAHSG